MNQTNLKFTIELTLDENGVYSLTAKDASNKGIKTVEIRNALQWALNRTNDEIIAATINAIFKTYQMVQK
jgi:hypothetical protein